MGEPGRGNALSSSAEFIGRSKQTEGTETSQYLQEKKETSISQVAASERETAKTDGMSKLAGVVPPVLRGRSGSCCKGIGESQTHLLVEQAGKPDHRG
jgi:hypothetical protein